MTDPALAQRAFTEILKHFIKSGRAPHFTELAETLGVRPEQALAAQREAAAVAPACWFSRDTDYIESWVPFSNVPTPYLIAVDGKQKWYGQ